MGSAAKPNELTRQVMVGAVPVGGGAPVAVQSMLNAPAQDVAANLAQIERLAEAGCEIVRMAIPRRDCLDAFAAVCEVDVYKRQGYRLAVASQEDLSKIAGVGKPFEGGPVHVRAHVEHASRPIVPVHG